jgi:Tol biopolymer transport system component
MDPCLKGPEMVSPNGRFDLTTFYGPVWSPDSQHILLENRTAEDASRLLYVDLANQFAVHIASNTQPLGWMADSNP